MNVIINNEGKDYIQNLAFIKAMLIKEYVESSNISYKEKDKVFKEVLEYLQKT